MHIFLHDWVFWQRTGDRIIKEVSKISEKETKVTIYGKEDRGFTLKKNEKIHDLDVILSKLKPPKIKPNK